MPRIRPARPFLTKDPSPGPSLGPHPGLGHRRSSGLPAGFFLTDSDRTPDPLDVIARLPRGFGVIFRHYDCAGRRALAAEVGRLCRARGLLLVVAADLRLARDVGARGLHLPQQLARQGRPHGLPPHWILTVAAHSRAALKRAAEVGADAALAGPALASASHPDAEALGPHRFGRMLSNAQIPVYALGGVNAKTLGKLPRQQLAGSAGIGGFIPDPAP